jgi:hypothetical protein
MTGGCEMDAGFGRLPPEVVFWERYTDDDPPSSSKAARLLDIIDRAASLSEEESADG